MTKTLLPILAITLLLLSCHGTRPTNLAMVDGKFPPCPDSPNCVSSMEDETDEEHYIEPIAFSSSRDSVISRLASVLEEMPRFEIIEQTDDYLYAEYTTPVFRFRDDMTFYLPDTGNLLHVRSASRLGEGDFGANRKRVEKIRTKLNE